jgi:hypothetical protein
MKIRIIAYFIVLSQYFLVEDEEGHYNISQITHRFPYRSLELYFNDSCFD